MTDAYATQDAASAARVASAKNLATVVYALQAASVIVGITVFVAVIINYVKMDEARGTWVESHFRWQIRTFWLSLLFGCLAFVAGLLLLGVFGLSVAAESDVLAGSTAGLGMLGILVIPFAMFVWYVYRVVKGWLRLNENQPVG